MYETRISRFRTLLFQNTKCDICEAEIKARTPFVVIIGENPNVPLGTIFPQKRLNVCDCCFLKIEEQRAETARRVR